MTEMTESVALEIWSTPSCPFIIEYSRRMLDDIRLAVVDAFFSLPRGGAEIGGVLLGKVANGRVTILEYAPLECEHIFGPSFTLSPADHGRLAEILAGASHQFSELQPVGWYHSHTRSDIFLSDGDLDLHNRYFPEPWQVALVLRPSTFQPVQGGFFFREPDGSIHTRGSYQEFALDPMPVGQVPRGMPAPAPQPISRQAEPDGPVITLMAAPVPTLVEPAPAPVVPAPTPAATVPAVAPTPAPAVSAPAVAPESTPVVPAPVFVEPEPAPQPVPVAEAALVPADEPAPPSRTTLLPPALPPIPRLELVPEPSETPRVPPGVPPNVPVTEVPGKGVFIPYAGPGTYEPAPPQHQPVAAQQPEAVTHTPWPLEVGTIQKVEAPATPVEAAPPVAEPPIAMTRFAAPEAPAEPQPRIEPAPTGESQPVAQPQPLSEQPAGATPSFLQMEPVRSRRKLWVVGAAAAIVVLSAGGYQQRGTLLSSLREVLPQRTSAPTPAAAPEPAPIPLTLPLSTSDQEGQLQIRWDGAAKAVTQARDGILQINDDGAATDLPLDAAHLQGGVFTYARHGEHVDARLTVQELDGTQVRTVTSFYGALPDPAKTAAADPVLRKQNSDLSKKNGDLASKNTDLAGKNADLTKINDELQQRLEELGKQTAKLKADMAAARTATAKENTELAQQNAQLHQQRDDLAKQNAKLKADLAARAAAPKQNAAPAPAAQPAKDAQLTQERDDLLIQIAKLKSDMTAQAAANKQGFTSQQNADFSKQRYQLTNRVSQLESDLAVETARADKLARQLEDSRKQQTQRRLQNQSGDPTQ